MSTEDVPIKCKECLKYSVSGYHRKCVFCQDMEFEEEVFCELTRAVQESSEFMCYAFAPKLEIVASEKTGSKESASPGHHMKQDSFNEILNSDKIKYQRALALQKLTRDPDAVFIQLKYHISWNVFKRTSIFNKTEDIIDTISSIFHDSSEEIDGFVHLLYLAPDHVHIFIESDGELFVEDMVNRLKNFSQNRILEKYSSLREKIGENNKIWDDAYFVETVG